MQKKHNYTVLIHVIFLGSKKEALSRAKKRFEEIKRYVESQVVKDSFDNLFINLKILVSNIKDFGRITFYYNGPYLQKDRRATIVLGFLVCQEIDIKGLEDVITQISVGDKFFIYFNDRFRFIGKKYLDNLFQFLLSIR